MPVGTAYSLGKHLIVHVRYLPRYQTIFAVLEHAHVEIVEVTTEPKEILTADKSAMLLVLVLALHLRRGQLPCSQLLKQLQISNSGFSGRKGHTTLRPVETLYVAMLSSRTEAIEHPVRV